MKMWLSAALLACCAPAMAQSSQGTAVPGDAYWSGGSQNAPALATPSAGASVPGDAYWSGSGQPGAAGRGVIPTSVQGVMADEVFRATQSPANSIPWARATAIQEAAAAYGAQAGMAARASAINNAATSRSNEYNRAFNFASVMLEPGFLPPVISEGRDAYNQPNDNEVRAADRIYKIEFAARLVNTPPRWQEYLGVPVSAPMLPDRTALPKTAPEKELWNDWASKGWSQGAAQADLAFESNLSRLRRDFEGMLRYKMLYQQGVVTKPILSRSNMGVTGGGDEMAINDRIYRITNKAQLNPNAARWSQPMPATYTTDSTIIQPATVPKQPGDH
jgi:defect-in-organelle-trafficking protein DotC